MRSELSRGKNSAGTTAVHQTATGAENCTEIPSDGSPGRESTQYTGGEKESGKTGVAHVDFSDFHWSAVAQEARRGNAVPRTTTSEEADPTNCNWKVPRLPLIVNNGVRAVRLPDFPPFLRQIGWKFLTFFHAAVDSLWIPPSGTEKPVGRFDRNRGQYPPRADRHPAPNRRDGQADRCTSVCAVRVDGGRNHDCGGGPKTIQMKTEGVGRGGQNGHVIGRLN